MSNGRYGTPQEILLKIEALAVQMSEYADASREPFDSAYNLGFRSAAQDIKEEIQRLKRFPKEDW